MNESASPQSGTYTLWQRWKDAAALALGRAASAARIPGAVQPFDYADSVTGDRVRIRVEAGHTVIAVNSREYWFRRWSGAFAGTGTYCGASGSGSDSAVVDSRLEAILESVELPELWQRPLTETPQPST